MEAVEYWNKIGSEKVFEDPLYLDKLANYIDPNAKILEYGCGYGRLLQILNANGYRDLVGFDFSQSMIERGKNLNPHLDLRLIETPQILPFKDESIDVVVMSTVLCCILEDAKQRQLIAELSRVLKDDGVLYLSDFLICDHPKYHYCHFWHVGSVHHK